MLRLKSASCPYAAKQYWAQGRGVLLMVLILSFPTQLVVPWPQITGLEAGLESEAVVSKTPACRGSPSRVQAQHLSIWPSQHSTSPFLVYRYQS